LNIPVSNITVDVFGMKIHENCHLSSWFHQILFRIRFQGSRFIRCRW
jgi:hypothetical protein